jgi:hypothetical protein
VAFDQVSKYHGLMLLLSYASDIHLTDSHLTEKTINRHDFYRQPV